MCVLEDGGFQWSILTGTVWCNRNRVVLESEMLHVLTPQAANVVPSSMEINLHHVWYAQTRSFTSSSIKKISSGKTDIK